MTRDELNQKIAALESCASSLEEPDHTLTMVKINDLKNQIDGMSLSDIAEKMSAITLPKIAAMDAKIKAAKDATAAQSMRVGAINSVVGMIKTGLGLML